ncbi:hypothetical protein BAE44_0011191 [Dichanthelium oligosanthes]|uniref:Cysteine-rich transmembrane domain-containing protein n=1 Tax=Dichanthelium oligosanthes TaxID=888268 RepID=A0A1E5VRP4_9POAL|nr:hypothetical protein BAE44_0011191 [Dichanthelium oligosanthes]
MSDRRYGYSYPPPQENGKAPFYMHVARVLALELPVCTDRAGYYSNGPPVMAPPQYQYAPPPRREPSFLEGCLAALCCCCLIDECCCDPSVIFVS